MLVAESEGGAELTTAATEGAMRDGGGGGGGGRMEGASSSQVIVKALAFCGRSRGEGGRELGRLDVGGSVGDTGFES